MATTAKSYKDFHNFPGKVIDGVVYEFPVLYSRTKLNRTRFWALKIILVKEREMIYDVDWNPEEEDIRKIDPEYFNSKTKLPNEIVALIYNEQGILEMKVTRHPPTKISGGSPGLVGKANERNTFTQALIDARGKWDKMIKNGYTFDEEVKKQSDDLYYAMAAQPYEIKRVTFPCLSQPKLDGVRCLMAPAKDKLIKYSRDQNIWPGFDNFDVLLLDAAKKLNIIIDGELYLHGKRLQEIVGVARNETKALELDYYIFDVIPLGNLKMPFEERLDLLENLKELCNLPSKKHSTRTVAQEITQGNTKGGSVQFVPTKWIADEKELNDCYKKYIADGYEGQMIRMPDAPYATSKYREARSYGILKRKKKFTAEFKFVDLSHGINGKQEGCFIGVLETKDGKRFNATPKGMTIQEMRDFYNEVAANMPKYLGKMATVEYEDISKDGKPLRPKFVTFREGNE